MNDISFDATYFNQSKENIVSASTYMNETLSSVSSVNASIPSSFKDSSTVTAATNNIKTICDKSGDIVKTYNGWETLTSSAEPTVESMSLINNDILNNLMKTYPFIANISNQRKAIITMAFEYLGQTDSSINWLSGIWCAKFAGGIINKALGMNIINNTDSVAKILGLSGNPNGLAFTTDSNYKYILSQAYTEKYKQNNGDLYGWKTAIGRFNSENARNVKGSDWIDETYVPQTGDLIFFNDVGNSKDKFNENAFYTNAYPGSDASVSHVGLVVGIRQENGKTYVDTIEGNVSDSVKVKSYDIGSTYIVGYGNIKYENIAKGFTVKKDESNSVVVPPVTESYDDSQYTNIPSTGVSGGNNSSINVPKDNGNVVPSTGAQASRNVTNYNGNNTANIGVGGIAGASIGGIINSNNSSTTATVNSSSTNTSANNSVNNNSGISNSSGTDYYSSSGSSGHSSSGSSSSGSSGHSSSSGGSSTPSAPIVTTPTNILPENKFSEFIPEVKYGKLGDMEISSEYVKYNISDIKENDYVNYLEGLNNNGFKLSDDGTHWFKNNNKLYVSYSDSNLTINLKQDILN